ncbi:MAG: family phage terminase small subunit [Bryobacterales bacterium]|nr:family phage terminase small subunit [Bryobacterales bacterium]
MDGRGGLNLYGFGPHDRPPVAFLRVEFKPIFWREELMGQHGPISVASKMARNVAQGTASAPAEPQEPEGLSDASRAEWVRITGLLRDRGALDALDQAALRDYLLCWDRLRECEAEITKHGVMVEGINGRQRVKNPACQLARQYRDALVVWSREIGLTFASRTRLAMPEQKTGENRFAQMAAECWRA